MLADVLLASVIQDMSCTIEEVQTGPYFGDTKEINKTVEWSSQEDPAKHTDEAFSKAGM